MKKIIAIMMFVAACSDDPKPEPMSCADVGCGSAALCNRKGDCVCNADPNMPVACRFEPAGSGSAQ